MTILNPDLDSSCSGVMSANLRATSETHDRRALSSSVCTYLPGSDILLIVLALCDSGWREAEPSIELTL